MTRFLKPFKPMFKAHTLFLLLLGWLLVLSGSVQSAPEAPLPDGELLTRLQAGGLVIYFRHGLTDWSQSDHSPIRLKDCQAQRNLSQAGRDQMQAIGAAIEVLKIPLAKVLGSPYCRTMDSARLAFGRVDVEDRLNYVGPMVGKPRLAQVEALRRLLASNPPQGRNTVLVAHRGNLLEATGLDLEEGEAAIYIPDGVKGPRLVGRLTRAGWESLVRTNAQNPSPEEECREPNRLPMGG